jgi:hypothetical protein
MYRTRPLAYLAMTLCLAACGDDDTPDTCSGSRCTPDAAQPPTDAGELDASEPGDTDGGAAEEAGLDAGDGTQAVSIRFKAKLGNQELVCGQNYAQQGTTQVVATPQDFRFYVQELRLIRKGTQEEERVVFDVLPPFQRAEVALIDFTDDKGSCGGSGGSIVNTTIRGRVPAGDYDGIVFVNGVPEELNHQRVETAAAPLDEVTMYWNWQSGYRFVVAELALVDASLADGGAHDAGTGDAGGGHNADAGDAGGGHDAGTGDAGGGHNADAGDAGGGHDAGAGDAGGGHGADGGGPHGGGGEAAFVHIGSTACTGTATAGFSCMRQARNEVRLSGFDPARSQVVGDLSAIFKTSNLRTPLQCHGIAAPCAAPYAALGIDMNSGNPTPSQLVFRVE